MNYLQQFAKYETIEEGEKKLQEAKDLYHSMGGTWYKEAVYDDLQELHMQLEIRKAKTRTNE